MVSCPWHSSFTVNPTTSTSAPIRQTDRKDHAADAVDTDEKVIKAGAPGPELPVEHAALVAVAAERLQTHAARIATGSARGPIGFAAGDSSPSKPCLTYRHLTMPWSKACSETRTMLLPN